MSAQKRVSSIGNSQRSIDAIEIERWNECCEARDQRKRRAKREADRPLRAEAPAKAVAQGGGAARAPQIEERGRHEELNEYSTRQRPVRPPHRRGLARRVDEHRCRLAHQRRSRELVDAAIELVGPLDRCRRHRPAEHDQRYDEHRAEKRAPPSECRHFFGGKGRAGFPATRSPFLTSFVTTEPAPVSAPSPIVTGATSDVFEPIETSLPIVVGFFCSPS